MFSDFGERFHLFVEGLYCFVSEKGVVEVALKLSPAQGDCPVALCGQVKMLF